MACDISLKSLDKGYNFSLDVILIKVLNTKLWGPKVLGVLTLRILGFLNGSLRTRCNLDVGLVERHQVYYKEEGGGFPQVWAVVSFVSSSLHVARRSTKSATNQLVVWFCAGLCE